MQALAVNPTERPAAGELVLTLERAHSRSLAAAAHDVPRPSQPVAPWPLPATGLGLVVLGLWARLLKGQQSRRRPPASDCCGPRRPRPSSANAAGPVRTIAGVRGLRDHPLQPQARRHHDALQSLPDEASVGRGHELHPETPRAQQVHRTVNTPNRHHSDSRSRRSPQHSG
jgi:hypothetical protein